MALFTSILAFAGSVTNALATAAAPNARRDFSTSGCGALDGLRAAAEATTNKQRIVRLSERRRGAALARKLSRLLICDKARGLFNRPPGSSDKQQGSNLAAICLK